MKNITLKQKEYFSKDEIELEISEEITAPVVVKTNTVTVGNINATIKELKRRRKESNDKFDEEIAYNQGLIDGMKTQIDATTITPRTDRVIPN